MNYREFELVYIRFKSNEQTLHFALGIPWIPVILNFVKSDLRRRSKMCASLDDFHVFQWVWIIVHQIYNEGANFAFRLRKSMSSSEFELPYIRFTRKEQTLPFALWILWVTENLNYSISDLLGRSKLCVSLWEFQVFQIVWISFSKSYKEGTTPAVRLWNSISSNEFKLFYIKFTRK